MQEFGDDIGQTINEMYLINTLNLDNKCILDLGCSNAKITKELKQYVNNTEIFACEVDLIQHKKNISLKDESIKFYPYAAQDMNFEDDKFDIIFLFKSFHHIPITLMSKALDEIKRVLKPNGLVYISEPLYLGKQNELVSIFHDEKEVRAEAFKQIQNKVTNNSFKLFREIFFNTEVIYDSFEDFEKKQMNLSYNKNQINKELYNKVKDKYEEYSIEGKASFLKAFRVDILQKI